MPRVYTLVDVLKSLQQTSVEAETPTDQVLNQFLTDSELVAIAETGTWQPRTIYPILLIERDGPLAYWRLDDPSGSSQAADSNVYGTKRPATVNGGVTFGQTGAMHGSQAALFDGLTGYLSSAYAPSGLSGFSVEAWVNPNNPTSTSYARIVSAESHAANQGWYLGLQETASGPGYAFFDIGTGSAWIEAASSTLLAGWHHLVGVWDGTAIHLYVDGALAASQSASSISWSTNPIRIGAAADGGGNYFLGTIDEVAFYAGPLGANSVSNHYAWGTAPTVDAWAYGESSTLYQLLYYPQPAPLRGSNLWGAAIWGGFVWG